MTQYKWIDEEFDNVYALLDFTYDQQLNNLNLDLFGIILADYFENIEDLFLYDITGKRSVSVCLLPPISLIINWLEE